MHSAATAKNLVGFIIGLPIATAFSITSVEVVSGARHGDMSITGATQASEAIRESLFRFLDLNDDDYLDRDEVPDSELTLKSMCSCLDENDDGRLSEPDCVLDARAL